jgi:hypothetical protein
MGAPWKGERVPNAPLRDAFLASGLTVSEVCRRLGWVRSDASSKGAETSRLKRGLGIEGTSASRFNRSRGYRPVSLVSTVEIGRAHAICEAIGVDFDELYAGLLPAQEVAGRCSSCGNPLLWPAVLCGFCEAEQAERFGVAA